MIIQDNYSWFRIQFNTCTCTPFYVCSSRTNSHISHLFLVSTRFPVFSILMFTQTKACTRPKNVGVKCKSLVCSELFLKVKITRIWEKILGVFTNLFHFNIDFFSFFLQVWKKDPVSMEVCVRVSLINTFFFSQTCKIAEIKSTL